MWRPKQPPTSIARPIRSRPAGSPGQPTVIPVPQPGGAALGLAAADGVLVIDHRPAANVDLILTTSSGDERPARTDASGAWRVEGVTAGEYTIRWILPLQGAR